MAATFSMQIEGLPELKRRVDGLSVELRRRAVRAALRAAARVVAAEAKRRAPIGNETRVRADAFGRSWGNIYPGLLRDSIGFRTRIIEGKPEADIGLVGKGFYNAYYGRFVERGTSWQPAQPWLRPAIDAAQQDAVRKFGAVLRAVINKYAERAGVA